MACYGRAVIAQELDEKRSLMAKRLKIVREKYEEFGHDNLNDNNLFAAICEALEAKGFELSEVDLERYERLLACNDCPKELEIA